MKSKYLYSLLIFVFYSINNLFAQSKTDPEKISVQIDLNKVKGPMVPIWAWFGHDEPNYTYMKDGVKLLSELAALSPTPIYMRVHNLLTSGDALPALKWGSTDAYTEDSLGNPVYDWHIIDSIFDTYIQRGIKPLAQIGFMPEALSLKPIPYRHLWQPGQSYKNIFTGWTSPPKDYNKWAELIYQWVLHSVARYGVAEVESWYWELWNEPDGGYWAGNVQEYCKLYDYTADAVKRALPSAKIGGPHITNPSGKNAALFMNTFLHHCVQDTNYVNGKIGAPLDFIAFHAKGSPKVINGHVQMNMSNQLRAINDGFKIVSSYPTLKNLPVIIGESDPEGCAACGMHTNPENAYRNGTMYSSYTAASFARKQDLADEYKINFIGAVTWAFEFENQPWFYGFRDLSTNGVDKPALNVFRMYGMMMGKRLDIITNNKYNAFSIRDSSVRGSAPDIGSLASKSLESSSVMVWNYHDDDLPASASAVEIEWNNLPAPKILLSHYRIDTKHSNAYEMWKNMGSPTTPSKAQIKILESSGQLELMNAPEWIKINKGYLNYSFQLPRQGVSLLKMDW